jgi:hypothetical protein
MYLEIERIGERFGVREQYIPEFITAVTEVISRHLLPPVEGWHGKATSNQQIGK